MLVGFGVRLVGAGGWFRMVSLAAGAGLAVVVLTLAWVLPDAMYPGDLADARRAAVTAVLAFVAAPTVALLLVVGRMSAEVRDRRLATLGQLGVRRGGLRLVAAVENTAPAAAGAVLGAASFLLLRPVVERVAGESLQAPIGAGSRLMAVALGVVAASCLLAMAGVGRLEHTLTLARAPSAAAPSPWRLAPLAVAVLALLVVARTPAHEQPPWLNAVLWTGVVVGVLAIALVTPLASWLIGRGVAAGASVSATLAGRRMLTGSPRLARRVTMLGVIAFCAPVLAAFAGQDAHTAAEVHALEQGPQRITIAAPEGLSPEVISSLAAIEGVQGVVRDYSAWPAAQVWDDPFTVARIFAGTCDELALVAVTQGCRDGVAAWLDTSWEGSPEQIGWFPDRVEHVSTIEVLAPDGSVLRLDDLATTVTMDVAPTRDQWPVPRQINLVVPPGTLEDAGFVPVGVDLVTEPGRDVWDKVEGAVAAHGLSVDTTPLTAYDRYLTQRTTVWMLAAASVAVALLAYAVESVDRARAERRGRARLVALGVPVGVLRRSQAVAATVPLLVALIAGSGLGILATWTLSRASHAVIALDPGVIGIAVTMTVVGASAVALLTLPLTRARIRSQDLRTE